MRAMCLKKGLPVPLLKDMAGSTNPQQTVGAALLIVFLLVASVTPALASTLTVFEGPGCSGKSKDINGCGCFNLGVYTGGFHFVYTEGQAAELYAFSNCASRELPDRLDVETRSCVRNEHRSVEMLC
ncbi:unnamed protein product [Spirodela intermedia]|uniref:Uncharacterized protein n=2 Tax=Spirodela intermedia TaxID=51605 RepID=A0A7I8K8W7_SPIIN|nr:unnamed protein product [Spirodela intermedia]CAA6658100.1 unnamed protein product [Spirodela intermedia]CAA6673945.1 unnamed protein product [Spirodela intermedia]CAA6674242.1 unnamed protein product [Spirodela intermedia]CAA7394229.1 unnamed protein product [Spirodela intermedia]